MAPVPSAFTLGSLYSLHSPQVSIPRHLVKTWVRSYSSVLKTPRLQSKPNPYRGTEASSGLSDLTFYYSPLHPLSSSHTCPRPCLTLSGTLLPQVDCTYPYMVGENIMIFTLYWVRQRKAANTQSGWGTNALSCASFHTECTNHLGERQGAQKGSNAGVA